MSAADRLAGEADGGAGERQRAGAQDAQALGLAAMHEPGGGGGRADELRVIGEPACRAQARGLRREPPLADRFLRTWC